MGGLTPALRTPLSTSNRPRALSKWSAYVACSCLASLSSKRGLLTAFFFVIAWVAFAISNAVVIAGCKVARGRGAGGTRRDRSAEETKPEVGSLHLDRRWYQITLLGVKSVGGRGRALFNCRARVKSWQRASQHGSAVCVRIEICPRYNLLFRRLTFGCLLYFSTLISGLLIFPKERLLVVNGSHTECRRYPRSTLI